MQHLVQSCLNLEECLVREETLTHKTEPSLLLLSFPICLAIYVSNHSWKHTKNVREILQIHQKKDVLSKNK